MLTITNAGGLVSALASPLPENVKALLNLRSNQLLCDAGDDYELGELAHWVIVGQGDALPAIETAVNYPILPDAPWEWVLDHGGIFEAPIILSDDGFGVVLIVPDEHGVDEELLALLRRDAVAVPASVAST